MEKEDVGISQGVGVSPIREGRDLQKERKYTKKEKYKNFLETVRK